MKSIFVRLSGVVFCLALFADGASAQPAAPQLDGREGRDLALDQFRPRSMLQLKQHETRRAKFPVVDVHLHGRIKLEQSAEALDDYVRIMDEQNIAVSVSLDGHWGEEIDEHLRFLNGRHSGRFVTFANIDWQGAGRTDEPATWDCNQPDFAQRVVERLRDAKQRGASGVKIFKQFGLGYRNADGSLLKIDDPRFDPIWRACGELGLPILIHVADPAAFFEPIDQHNERWEELNRHPEWSFYGPQWPRREALLQAFIAIVERHPQTVFIGAHVAGNAEDLRAVGAWLEKYPNLNVEIAARIAELGRQPYSSRKFFLDHADRILFGTDGPRSRERLYPHWRMLETWDEYFPYANEPFPPQGLWNIDGLGLPDDVLRKVYYVNACRIIPGVKALVDTRLPAIEK
ncbi:MAG: amidohydrolase family protein [Planctomycetia bacterium]|nr:amidohydrolase family protein [Planctomycetia bacterium]